MLGIGSFFDKFRNRAASEIVWRSAVVDAIKQIAGFEIDPADFSYSNGVIFLKNASSGARGALFIKKAQVILQIKNRTGKEVKDIR